MSMVILLGSVLLGVSVLALYAKQVRKVDLGLFAHQSSKLILAMSALFVPLMLVLSACQVME